jgi:hypothetical protein
MSRVGQNHTYTVHVRYFWQGNHQIHGHIRCIYTVLANPSVRLRLGIIRVKIRAGFGTSSLANETGKADCLLCKDFMQG